MNNSYTNKIAEVLVYSAEEARRMSSDVIAPEHLLLGLLRDGDNQATNLLQTIQVDLRKLREQVLQVTAGARGAVPVVETKTDIPDEMSLDATASQIMKIAQLEARLSHEQKADTQHLLLALLKQTGNQLDIISVCTPNYLHDAHTRYALRLGADVICEKPLVLNPWNVDVLQNVENETGRKVYNILQLRLHPAIIALKNKVENAPQNIVYDVDLTYITSRGYWYYTSWKGNESKSGGIATNIGIHFYDMLCHIFGNVQESIVHVATHDRVAGFIRFDKARVRYFLSINKKTLPKEVLESGKTTFRQIVINGEPFEFSDGFTDLHTESYRRILAGEGFGLDEVRPCIQIVYDIRNATPVGLRGDYHPLASLPCENHPFLR